MLRLRRRLGQRPGFAATGRLAVHFLFGIQRPLPHHLVRVLVDVDPLVIVLNAVQRRGWLRCEAHLDLAVNKCLPTIRRRHHGVVGALGPDVLAANSGPDPPRAAITGPVPEVEASFLQGGVIMVRDPPFGVEGPPVVLPAPNVLTRKGLIYNIDLSAEVHGEHLRVWVRFRIQAAQVGTRRRLGQRLRCRIGRHGARDTAAARPPLGGPFCCT